MGKDRNKKVVDAVKLGTGTAKDSTRIIVVKNRYCQTKGEVQLKNKL